MDAPDDNEGLEQLMESVVGDSDAQTEVDSQVEPVVDEQVDQEPVVSEQETEEVAPSTALRDALKAQGYGVDEFDNDESLIEYMSEGYDRAKHAPDPSEIERLRKVEADYARLQREKETVPDEPAKDTAPVSKWSPPPMSDRATDFMDRGLVGRDENGKLGVFNSVSNKFEYDPRYEKELTEVEDHLQWQAKASRQLTRDPLSALKDAGLLDYIKKELQLDKVDERAAEKIRAELRQENEDKAIDSYWEEHRKEYLELDDKGEIKTILHDGQRVPIPNARGEAYLDIVDDLKAAGASEYKAHLRAVDLVSKFATPEPEAKPEPAAKKKAFLKKTREQGHNGHKPVNRVFPDLATAATEVDAAPSRLEDVLRQALLSDE